jgi:mannose-6-phosphate isomerase
MERLQCGYQAYAWGKPAATSKVAALVGMSGAADRFAELWVGTHPSKPSRVVRAGKPAAALSSVVSSDTAKWLGREHTGTFGTDVPFLLKVLSIDKALSIQLHPERGHAAALHKKDPANYPDANHKPELVVALTPFQALCCFRPLAEIVGFLEAVPQLRALVPSYARFERVAAGALDAKVFLRAVLDDLYAHAADVVAAAAAEHVRGFPADAAALSKAQAVFARVHGQFPGDVGLWFIYLLNIVDLQPGDGLFMAPNEPHSYLAGDCVEIMAASDNVIRAGLTPKFKDVTTMLDCLTYGTDSLNGLKFTAGAAAVQRYQPPAWCNDFQLAAVRLGASEAAQLPMPASVLLGVVTSGSGVVGGVAVETGACFALPATQAREVHVFAGATGIEVFFAATGLHKRLTSKI